MTSRNIAAAIILVALCHLAYWNSLRTPFQFDDHWQILGNRDIRNVWDPATVWGFNPRRFVLMYSFAINWALGGESTWNYHYTNLLIHAANAILIFLLGRMILARLSGRTGSGISPGVAAFFAALFFTVHPLLTEGVTYISGRSSSLCALFGMLALLLYMRGRTATDTKRAVVYTYFAVVSCVLAMLTKELGAIIPLLVLLVEYFCFFRAKGLAAFVAHVFVVTVGWFFFFLKRDRPQWPASREERRPYLVAPFAAVTAVLVAYVVYCLSRYGMLATDEGYLSLPYLLTQFKVWVLYLAGLVCPLWLNIDHRIPLAQGLSADILFPMLIIAGLIAAAALLARRKGLGGIVSFAVFWMAISLLPTSSVFFLRDAMAERHMYFPAIGLFMLFGCVVAAVVERARALVGGGSRIRPLYLPVLFLCGVFGFMTVERNAPYADHLKLWLNVEGQEPDSYRAAYSCGLGWMEHALWRGAQGFSDRRDMLLRNCYLSLWKANRLGSDGAYETYMSMSDAALVEENFPKALHYAIEAVYVAEKGKGGTLEVYSRLVRAYFFAGKRDFLKGMVMKEDAQALEKQGRTDVQPMLAEATSYIEQGKENLDRCIRGYANSLGRFPAKYESEDEFVNATDCYYEANKLLAIYYRDKGMGEWQEYFNRWAGYVASKGRIEDLQTAVQFFNIWREQVIKGERNKIKP